MNVTFADFGSDIASSRLRAKIPQEALGRLGIGRGRDVLIYGKHFVSEGQLHPYKRLIYDVCDDHFAHPELGAYYRRHCQIADALTCNSEVMRERIKQETGRDATVIREPYENAEHKPSIGPRLLWYGHKSNIKDLERVKPDLKQPLLVLSNHPDYEEWTPDIFREAIRTPCIVIIPTGKSPAKSENRMVEAIRCGKFVCAEPLPSYEQFGQFMPLGSIPENIESALANPSDAIQRIKDAQDYIRDRYSPEAIAQQWLEVIQ